jgi:hypothetical protein
MKLLPNLQKDQYRERESAVESLTLLLCIREFRVQKLQPRDRVSRDFRCFPRTLQANAGTLPYTRKRTLLSISLSSHYSLINLSFDAISLSYRQCGQINCK